MNIFKKAKKYFNSIFSTANNLHLPSIDYIPIKYPPTNIVYTSTIISKPARKYDLTWCKIHTPSGEYTTNSEVAKAYGITTRTVYNRVMSISSKYKEWYYIPTVVDNTVAHGSKPKALVFRGRYYSSKHSFVRCTGYSHKSVAENAIKNKEAGCYYYLNE